MRQPIKSPSCEIVLGANLGLIRVDEQQWTHGTSKLTVELHVQTVESKTECVVAHLVLLLPLELLMQRLIVFMMMLWILQPTCVFLQRRSLLLGKDAVQMHGRPIPMSRQIGRCPTDGDVDALGHRLLIDPVPQSCKHHVPFLLSLLSHDSAVACAFGKEVAHIAQAVISDVLLKMGGARFTGTFGCIGQSVSVIYPDCHKAANIMCPSCSDVSDVLSHWAVPNSQRHVIHPECHKKCL